MALQPVVDALAKGIVLIGLSDATHGPRWGPIQATEAFPHAPLKAQSPTPQQPRVPVGVALGVAQPAAQEPVAGGEFKAHRRRGVGRCRRQGRLDSRRRPGAELLIGIQKQHPVAAQAAVGEGPVALLTDQKTPLGPAQQHPGACRLGQLKGAIAAAGIKHQQLLAPGEGGQGPGQVLLLIEGEHHPGHAGHRSRLR